MESMSGMSMPSMTMAMSTTGTGMAAMASNTGMPMEHDMGGMMGGCKINMLWNWYTIDACFLSSSWHITSKGMFAGSCIGVILLVLVLEFLRRAGKEYDRFLLAQHIRSLSIPTPASSASSHNCSTAAVAKAATSSTAPTPNGTYQPIRESTFRPNVMQQAIRALLHMLQFAVAYFIMLLAMYYNGYIIICIFIGAYLGYFVFGWESFKVGGAGAEGRLQEEVTVCCG